MDQNQKPTQPQAQEHTPAQGDEQMQSRRQFVTRMARRAAYVAPAVIALSANKSAFGSGASGGS